VEDRVIRVTARIMGEDYTIRGRASEEHILRIARFVDERMLQIAEAYPKLGTSRVAVLAAINMADELLKIREQYEQLTQLLEEEWSQRHGSRTPDTPKSPPSAGRLPSPAAQETAAGLDDPSGQRSEPVRGRTAAGLPGQTQIPAFEESETGSVMERAGDRLYTGDALETGRDGEASPPGEHGSWEPPEDEDQ